MCGKRCTIECSAKEPASAPRKGGGTGNFGVDISLSPMHPHPHPLGCRCLVAQLLERIIDHHKGASKSGSSAVVSRSRQTYGYWVAIGRALQPFPRSKRSRHVSAHSAFQLGLSTLEGRIRLSGGEVHQPPRAIICLPLCIR